MCDLRLSLPNDETLHVLIYFRWAMQEGYGAKLIKSPALIKDIVRQTVSRVPGLPVSIKIRIHDDTRYTSYYFV